MEHSSSQLLIPLYRLSKGMVSVWQFHERYKILYEIVAGFASVSKLDTSSPKVGSAVELEASTLTMWRDEQIRAALKECTFNENEDGPLLISLSILRKEEFLFN